MEIVFAFDRVILSAFSGRFAKIYLAFDTNTSSVSQSIFIETKPNQTKPFQRPSRARARTQICPNAPFEHNNSVE
jgi:hypothetical protein